jgi:hypothetical protein
MYMFLNGQSSLTCYAKNPGTCKDKRSMAILFMKMLNPLLFYE